MTHSFRLVVADDHVLLREGIVAILESDPDFEVVAECDDGPAAVAACRSLSPDLVLMDVQMPGGDGLAAAEEILRSCPGVRRSGGSCTWPNPPSRRTSAASSTSWARGTGYRRSSSHTVPAWHPDTAGHPD